MAYGLAPDIHIADVDGDLVLLDARHDRYFCLPRGAASPLKAALMTPSHVRPELPGLEALEAAGLFSGDVAPNRNRPTESKAACDLFGEEVVLPRPRPRDVVGLLALHLHARCRTAAVPPRRWLRDIAWRNARFDEATTAEAARHLARRVFATQPYLPRATRCLPASMTLIALLHRHHVPGRLVFGVRTYPFEAHCWVEHRGVVLNDTFEHVRWFTPIADA